MAVKKHQQQHKPLKPNALVVGALALGGLLVGLVAMLVFTSWQARGRYESVEVTFISPQHGVLFWKTEKPVLGYAQWGASRHERSNKLDQTSSDPSEVHAVLLTDIPPDGLYVSLHTKNEPKIMWPKVYYIKYQEGSEGGPLE